MEVMFLHMLIGLSEGLHKNCETEFHEVLMQDGSQLRIGTITLWCGS